GVPVASAKGRATRKDFWRSEPEAMSSPTPMPTPIIASPSPGAPVALPVPTFTPYPAAAPAPATTTISVPLAGNVSIVIGVPDDAAVSLSPADVRALRAAAAPLVAELAKRGLIAPAQGTLEEP